MQPGDFGKLCLELRKTALRSCDYGRSGNKGVCLQHLIESLPLPGLVHEKGQLRLDGGIKRTGKVPCPAHLWNNAPSGLLGGLLGYALPALQLLFRGVGLGNATVGIKELYLDRKSVV